MFSLAEGSDIIFNSVLPISPNVGLPPAPKNIKEALAGPDKDLWRQAIELELQTLEEYKTFAYADQVGHAMKMKVILTLSYRNDYTLKYKARLVVCGYSQIKGIDYEETYSPTTAICTVFMLLHLGAHLKSTIAGFDVTAAFLEGKNDFLQYCRLPPELGGMRLLILNSLYGEKQAPKIWYDRIHEILSGMGFARSTSDPCLYTNTHGVPGDSDYMYMHVTIHIDDGLMIASSQFIIDNFMSEFNEHIRKITLFPTVVKYLGMDISYVDDYVDICQKTYIDEKLTCPRLVKTCKIPMSSSENLREAVPNEKNPSLLPVTGKLRYLADRTRPDILVATGEISTGGNVSPSDKHMVVSRQVVGYIKDTSDLKLRLGGPGALKPFGFTDAQYYTAGESKCRVGGCIFLNLFSGAMFTYSRLYPNITHSSMGIEIVGIDYLMRSLIHVMLLLGFLGYEQTEPCVIYCDNKSAIELMKTLKSGHKTKHINVLINYIRECINKRMFVLVFVRTDLNVADVLTKPLADKLYHEHVEHLMHGFGGYFDPEREAVYIYECVFEPDWEFMDN